MANEAFQSAFNLEFQAQQQRKAQADAQKRVDREQQIGDLMTQRQELADNLKSLHPGTPEYDQMRQQLQGVVGGIQDFYHPQKNPGAIQQFGHMLTDHLGLTKPQATDTMVNPHAKGLVEAGNLPIWNRPAVQNADGSQSSEYSTSFQDDHGHEVLVPTVVNGKFLTPDGKKPAPGSPEEKAMFDAAWDHYQKTGENLGKFNTPEAANAYAQTLHTRGTPPKNIAQQQARTASITKATEAAMASAPMTAAQVQVEKMKAELDEIEKSGMDDEGKKAARAKVFGVTTTIKPNWQQFKLPSGILRSYDLNKPEEIPEGASEVPKGAMTTAKENIANYEDALAHGYKGSFTRYVAEQRRLGAPSTSGVNLYAAAYQRAYGIEPNQMTPQDWDFINRKIAFDKAIPQTTTTNTTKQNFQNQWVPIQETNVKSPGGAPPTPPRGKPIVADSPPPSSEDLTIAASPSPESTASQPPQAPGATSASPTGAPATTPTTSAPTSPRALLDEAHKRKPTAGSSETPKAGGANASVKVGTPLFAAPNKMYSDAKSAYQGALTRMETMDKNSKDAYKGDQQAMLSLVANHIGMTLGAQKGARINQSVWNEAVASAPVLGQVMSMVGHFESNGDYVFDGTWKKGVTLTGDQIKSMVHLAHEQVVTLKESQDRIGKSLNEGVQYPSKPDADGGGNGGDAPPKATKPAPKGATHRIKHGNKWYYTDDQGNNLGEIK